MNARSPSESGEGVTALASFLQVPDPGSSRAPHRASHSVRSHPQSHVPRVYDDSLRPKRNATCLGKGIKATLHDVDGAVTIVQDGLWAVYRVKDESQMRVVGYLQRDMSSRPPEDVEYDDDGVAWDIETHEVYHDSAYQGLKQMIDVSISIRSNTRLCHESFSRSWDLASTG